MFKIDFLLKVDFFRIPPSPFPKGAPPLYPSPFSMVFTPPSVPPLAGDRNLREEEGNRPTRCSEPLRSKVGGPSKVFAMAVRDGTALLKVETACVGLTTACYNGIM